MQSTSGLHLSGHVRARCDNADDTSHLGGAIGAHRSAILYIAILPYRCFVAIKGSVEQSNVTSIANIKTSSFLVSSLIVMDLGVDEGDGST